MMFNRSVILCFLFSWSSFAKAQQQDTALIRNVLHLQQQAWNSGDLNGYMQGYWKSDSLVFVGKKGVTKGWQQTYTQYQKSYPDKSAMGTLSFDIISIEQINHETAYVIGKWHLQRNPALGDLQGHFTLLFKKINDQWRIVSDHSS